MVTIRRKSGLAKRSYPLRPYPAQMAYANSRHRFNAVPAGRRSGKTERAKRKLVRAALNVGILQHNDTPRFFAGAPTQLQAKRIWWNDLVAMLAPWTSRIMVSELTIFCTTGSEVVVTGLDKPERIEGSPWDGGVIDEVANCPAHAWGSHVRPALSTLGRMGWCDLIGVPEGRNHYYDIWREAYAEMTAMGERSEWGAFTWHSSVVLPPAEIEAARRQLDDLTFQQEYEASFINFSGRAYYAFHDANIASVRGRYRPDLPLIFCFDFNVEPGVAVVCQELRLTPDSAPVTCVIGEVYIPTNSDTVKVCRKLAQDWAHHQGRIEVYGDPSGGQRRSSSIVGTDWDLVKVELWHAFGRGRVSLHVPAAAGSERGRVNAVNTRCLNVSQQRRLFVDGAAAPHVVRDLEGVRVVEGGSGEIDKAGDKRLTHISDALGYYIVVKFPVTSSGVGFSSLNV